MRYPDDVPVLSSGDVTLRALQTADEPFIVEQCLDRESIRWTTVPLDYTPDMAHEFVTSADAGWQSGASRLFAIESTHPDGVRRFSGSIALRDEGSRRAEIAFGAHPAIRGRGVMSTAASLILDYGFGECDLETVLWYANVGNFGSRRVAWRAGFTFGGTVRRWLVHRGEHLDGWVATLHCDDPRVPTTIWRDPPVIEGNGVRLRPMDERDIPRLVEAGNDDRSQLWLPHLPAPFTAQHAEDFLLTSRLRAAQGEGLQWCIADPATDEFLGTIGLPRSGRVSWEIGYSAHPSARGRGVMSEAVRLVTRHIMIPVEDGGLGARRAFIKTGTGNAASRHVAESNGYRLTGVDRGAEPMRDGTFGDLAVYDILTDEWAHLSAGTGGAA